jgi:hypothetical protein
VVHLQRTSSPRYGKEKVNATHPSARLACEGRIVFLGETAVVAGCIIVVEGDPAPDLEPGLLCRECEV